MRRRWGAARGAGLSVALLAAGLSGAVAAADPAETGPPVNVSRAQSPFAAGCDRVARDGTNYANSEVEVRIAVDPRNPSHAVGVWQQDRWSSGGAHGLVAATTTDGATWQRSFAPFSRCAGGTPANHGDYTRSSDPWVDIAPNGDVWQVSLSVNLAATTTGVLVSRSKDGGGFRISRVDLKTTADVPGIDADGFQQAAQAAKEGCPVSQALAAVEITLDASLAG